MSRSKIILLVLLVGAVIAFYVLDLGRYFSFDYIKSQQQAFSEYTDANPIKARGGYFILYILITALSLPGALILTLLGGALFGFWWGLLLISFASSIGATIAFLCSRYLFKDTVSTRFSSALTTINKGIDKDGAFYLFGLRLVPILPFFLINIVMGLTSMATRTFYIVSQIGMLPGTALYVNAGTQLGSIESPKEIFNLSVLTSLVLLAVFPFVVKKGMDWYKSRNE